MTVNLYTQEAATDTTYIIPGPKLYGSGSGAPAPPPTVRPSILPHIFEVDLGLAINQ